MITYLLGLIFLVALVVKLMGYSRMPIHLRWELYPLPGETKRPWGGSYLEEPQWWAKHRPEKKPWGEYGYMGKEIFLFREYLRHNRGLWYIIYPFHVGGFLLALFALLLFVGAITAVCDVTVAGDSPDTWGQIVYYATLIVGVAGLILGTGGTLALLLRKMLDPVNASLRAAD